jgi:hypothetical protein
MKQILPLLSFISALYLSSINLQARTNADPVKNILEQSNNFYNSTSSILGNPDDNDSKFVIYITDGILNIKYNKPAELLNGEVIIYNLLGQEIAKKALETVTINQITLSVRNTCYIVKINYSGKVHTQKVVPSGQ